MSECSELGEGYNQAKDGHGTWLKYMGAGRKARENAKCRWQSHAMEGRQGSEKAWQYELKARLMRPTMRAWQLRLLGRLRSDSLGAVGQPQETRLPWHMERWNIWLLGAVGS